MKQQILESEVTLDIINQKVGKSCEEELHFSSTPAPSVSTESGALRRSLPEEHLSRSEAWPPTD